MVCVGLEVWIDEWIVKCLLESLSPRYRECTSPSLVRSIVLAKHRSLPHLACIHGGHHPRSFLLLQKPGEADLGIQSFAGRNTPLRSSTACKPRECWHRLDRSGVTPISCYTSMSKVRSERGSLRPHGCAWRRWLRVMCFRPYSGQMDYGWET